MKMRKILLYFALKYQGNYALIMQAIKNKEQVSSNELTDIEKKIKCHYVTIIDREYPKSLIPIANPPIVLFYYGDLSLTQNEKEIIAIIGNRKYSSYGQKMTQQMVKELQTYNVIIVSGLATGIDSIAHRAALDNQIPTIAVLGSGIDCCYPSCNKQTYERIKKEGLILSEYPNDVSPEPKNFLIRNRIIAALSKTIVVTEAKHKSGTMNTVAYGLEYGKDICAIPYLAGHQSGCNDLIKQGAKLVESARDIYE